MSKKKIIIIASLFLVVVLGIGAFLIPNFIKQNMPEPEPTTTTVVPVDPKLDNAKLQETEQFKSMANSFNNYQDFLINGKLNQVPVEELVLSTWTIDKYIENAIVNPYFVSGYWNGEDSYALSSIETYVSPYLSETENAEFLAEAIQVKEGNISDAFANKLYMPSNDLIVPEQCYDTWEQEYCFSEAYTVNNLDYVGQENGSLLINMNLTMHPLYQKPNSPEGNLSSQDRTYSLTFQMKRINEPTTNDTELPIMIIEDVQGSLVINGLQDYLINEG
jgi:hypothetical protein